MLQVFPDCWNPLMEIVFIGNFGTSMQSFAFYTVIKVMNQEIKERLLQLRKNIDEVDEELLKVLNRRAELVIEVGQIKQKENIQVLDSDREAQLMARLSTLNDGPIEDEMLKDLFQSIIDILKRLQV